MRSLLCLVESIENTYVLVPSSTEAMERRSSLTVSVKEERKAICRLPMTRGDCDQQIARWYYNPLDEFCHSFQYTGCRTYPAMIRQSP